MTDDELNAMQEALDESTLPYPEVPEWIPWESRPVDMPLKAADVLALIAEVRRLHRFAKLVDDLGIKVCVPRDHPDHPDNSISPLRKW